MSEKATLFMRQGSGDSEERAGRLKVAKAFRGHTSFHETNNFLESSVFRYSEILLKIKVVLVFRSTLSVTRRSFSVLFDNPIYKSIHFVNIYVRFLRKQQEL